MILSDQFFQFSLTLRHLILRRSGIDHLCIEHLPGLIHHCQLTAGTKGRIPAKHYLSCDGRLHQKLLQILSKHIDGAILRFLRQLIPDLPFDSRFDQAVIAVLRHFLQNRCGIFVVRQDRHFLQITKDLLLRRLHFHRQDLFLFSSVQSQYSMTRHLFQRLFISIIHLVHAFCLPVFRLADKASFPHGQAADKSPVVRLIRDSFRQNIFCPLQSLLRRQHTLFLINIFFRFLLYRHFGILQFNKQSKRFQTLFFCNACPGLSLRSVGTV